MELLQGLLSRVSQPVLQAPGPDHAQIELAVKAAICVPDHRNLQAWRYIVIEGEGRERLAEIYARSQSEQAPQRSAAEIDRLRQQPLRAPTLIMAVLRRQDAAQVPLHEQYLSMGASVQNLLLALMAQGWAAIWRTGALAEDCAVAQALGLREQEMIAGVIYVGTTLNPRQVSRPPPESFWEIWS